MSSNYARVFGDASWRLIHAARPPNDVARWPAPRVVDSWTPRFKRWRRAAVGLGFILNGRGAMELVVAGIAYERGFIDANLFSVLVLVGVVTTLVTPMAFNAVVSRAQRERYRETGAM